jgi:hypothetical protein
LPQCGQNSVRFVPSVSNSFPQCWHLALAIIIHLSHRLLWQCGVRIKFFIFPNPL